MPQGKADGEGSGSQANREISVDTGSLTSFAQAIYTVYTEEIEPLAKKAKAKLQGDEASDNERRGGSSANGAVTLGTSGAQYYGSIVGRDHAMYAMNAMSYVDMLADGFQAAAYGTASFANDLKTQDGNNSASIDVMGRNSFNPLASNLGGGNRTGTGRGSNPDTLKDKNASGATSTESMSEEEIIAIVEADHAQVPRMREQAEGWKHVKELATTIRDSFRSNRKAHLSGESWTLDYVRDQIKTMESGAENAAEAAGGNATGMNANADEAERVKKRIDELKGDASTLDGMTPKERADLQKSQLEGGEPGSFADLRGSVTEDMRHEIGEADNVYRGSYVSHMGNTPAYEGLPKWEGPIPDGMRKPHEDTGGQPTGLSGGGHNGEFQGGSTSRDVPQASNEGISGGPELQTPGAPSVTPSPGPTVPGGGTPPPTGGGAPIPTPFVPGGSTPPGPGTGPVRPAIPPAGGRPTTGPAARPTPGISGRSLPGGGASGNRSGMAGAPGRGGVPGRGGQGGPAVGGRNGTTGGSGTASNRGGRLASGPNKAERSMLPNQRATSRNAKDKAMQRRGGDATEDLFSQRKKTVRPVIGKRDTGVGVGGRTPKSVVAEGKVFGARLNKTPKSQRLERPNIAKSTLNKHGIFTTRDGVRQWTNQPGKLDGKVTQGKVFGERVPVDTKPTASKLRELRRQRRSQQRTEILSAWRERKGLVDDHPVTQGLHDTVVPPVIKPRAPGHHVDRADVGRVFGRRGWENG